MWTSLGEPEPLPGEWSDQARARPARAAPEIDGDLAVFVVDGPTGRPVAAAFGVIHRTLATPQPSRRPRRLRVRRRHRARATAGTGYATAVMTALIAWFAREGRRAGRAARVASTASRSTSGSASRGYDERAVLDPAHARGLSGSVEATSASTRPSASRTTNASPCARVVDRPQHASRRRAARRRSRAPSSRRGRARGRGRGCGRGRRRRGRAGGRAMRCARSRSVVDLRRPSRSSSVVGLGEHGAGAQRVEPVLLAVERARRRTRSSRRAQRARCGRTPRGCPGTTWRAASVGVEARTSATRSSSGASCSWPIALTTGVRHADTARTIASSENGSRSSTEPPPRAMTITSTAVVGVELADGLDDLGDRRRALDGDVADLEPHGGPAAARVLERRRARRRTRARTPARRRRGGTAAPACGAGRTRPRRARTDRRCSIRASSSPRPTGRISVAASESVPRPT